MTAKRIGLTEVGFLYRWIYEGEVSGPCTWPGFMETVDKTELVLEAFDALKTRCGKCEEESATDGGPLL